MLHASRPSRVLGRPGYATEQITSSRSGLYNVLGVIQGLLKSGCLMFPRIRAEVCLLAVAPSTVHSTVQYSPQVLSPHPDSFPCIFESKVYLEHNDTGINVKRGCPSMQPPSRAPLRSILGKPEALAITVPSLRDICTGGQVSPAMRRRVYRGD